MKIMITFESTEDYILDVDSSEEAVKLVNKIWHFKQEGQEDLLKQYNIEYHLDVVKSYQIEDEEIQDLKLYDQYFDD